MKRKYLPAAPVGKPYKAVIQLSTPSPIVIETGSLPKGLTLSSDGTISGTAFESCTKILTLAAGSLKFEILISALRELQLPEAQKREDFVAALQEAVTKRGTWSVGITSLTSQTLIDLMSAIGIYEQARVDRALADAFQDTAQSLYAKRCISLMKGIRLNRKLPNKVKVSFTVKDRTKVPAYSQFSSGMVSLFAATPFILEPGTTSVVLHEGIVNKESAKGLGTPHQSYVLNSREFIVSDEHIAVTVDGVPWQRTLNGLWHCKGTNAFEDTTLADGRPKIQFGTSLYGGSPAAGSNVEVTYAITTGQHKAHLGEYVESSISGLRGLVESDLYGGMDEKPYEAYRYLDSFGTFGSALSKKQITSLVVSYPGVLDCLVERSKGAINISILSVGCDIDALRAHVDEMVAYGPDITVTEAQPEPVDVSLEVFGNVDKEKVMEAVRNLFTPRHGSIRKAVFAADIIAAAKAVPGVVNVIAQDYLPDAGYLTMNSIDVTVSAWRDTR